MTNTPSIAELSRETFWNNLCPELNIDAVTALQDLSGVGYQQDLDATWEQCKQVLHTDGYFAYPSWFSETDLHQLRSCIEKLAEVKLPPIFAFVFDEFWELMVGLTPLMSDLLEDEFQFLPAIWAWHVTPENQTAFAPHRDQVQDADDDPLDYLTLWVPLTDLDHRTSCICVLPASADLDYQSGVSQATVNNLQDVRTLQGPAGSVFCWTTGLIHWGTRQSVFGQPRMSVGFYVQNPDAECHYPPPLDFSEPLSLNQRLAIIGQQILFYSREAKDDELTLAKNLAQMK